MKIEDYHALVKAFDPGVVRKKPGQGGKKMDYVSHGSVTERLNQVDPDWSMDTRATYTYAGKDGRLHVEGVEIALTVCGVTRVEAGGPQRQDGFANEIKNAYSDALKRAAMRFGVALTIWESSVEAQYDEDVNPDYEPPAPAPRQTPQEPQNAAETTTIQERTIAEAWDMASEAQPYPAVVNHLRQLQADASPDQWTAIKRALAAIKAKHYAQPEEVAR